MGEFLPVGAAHYESLQATVLKRMGASLTMQGSFTWSHEIGLCCGTSGASPGGEETAPNIPIPQYQFLAIATMPLDRTFNFHYSTLYQLPFGKTKQYLQHGVGAALAGGFGCNSGERQ